VTTLRQDFHFRSEAALPAAPRSPGCTKACRLGLRAEETGDPCRWPRVALDDILNLAEGVRRDIPDALCSLAAKPAAPLTGRIAGILSCHKR
jgi:hypothetical protein